MLGITDDNNIGNDRSLVFHFLRELNSISVRYVAAPSNISPQKCSAEMMVELVSHKKKFPKQCKWYITNTAVVPATP